MFGQAPKFSSLRRDVVREEEEEEEEEDEDNQEARLLARGAKQVFNI